MKTFLRRMAQTQPWIRFGKYRTVIGFLATLAGCEDLSAEKYDHHSETRARLAASGSLQ